MDCGHECEYACNWGAAPRLGQKGLAGLLSVSVVVVVFAVVDPWISLLLLHGRLHHRDIAHGGVAL